MCDSRGSDDRRPGSALPDVRRCLGPAAGPAEACPARRELPRCLFAARRSPGASEGREGRIGAE